MPWGLCPRGYVQRIILRRSKNMSKELIPVVCPIEYVRVVCLSE